MPVFNYGGIHKIDEVTPQMIDLFSKGDILMSIWK
jgi:hypothetical protein